MIIIPMAGMSRRFTEAGYDRPKYMLPLAGETLFHWTVSSFRGFFNRELIVFVYRDVQNTTEFIEREMTKLGVRADCYRLIRLDSPTSGQAETVALGCKALPELLQESVTIFNIDTIRNDYTHPSFVQDGSADGFIEVFSADGDHWSFVDPLLGTDRVARTTEKVRISPYCSDGLYYFRTANLFLKAYQNIENVSLTSLQGGERYIAPLYNDLIRQGYDVRFAEVPAEKLHFSGTPDEYLSMLRSCEEDNGAALRA